MAHGGENTHTHTDTCTRTSDTGTAERQCRVCVIAHIGGSFYTREQTRNDYCLLLFSRTIARPRPRTRRPCPELHAASLRVGLQALGAPPLLNGEPGIIVAAK